MKPNDPTDRRAHTPPLVPQRSLLKGPHIPSRNSTASQIAAAGIVRTQIDHAYKDSEAVQSQHQAIKAENGEKSPYHRTQHNPATIHEEQWKQYHSAWQEYYKQYYERYYVGQVYNTQRALEAENIKRHMDNEPAKSALSPQQPETLTHDEAMYDLRSKLREKVTNSARKVRKSRHFVPITAAAGVVLLFLFLQFNRVLIANVQAYVSPGNIDPANLIVDPTASINVSADPKLIIPKINVDVPVIYNTTPDYDSQMKAMQTGVAYFGIPGANSRPGQIGNTVLSGHSSNDIIDQGDYKFIFARLDHLIKGDTVYLNYQSKRYVYTVTKTEVVKPTDVSKLVYPTDKPILTLITCTPLGTSLNRLLVTAEQVSPDPKTAAPTSDSSVAMPTSSIPGSSPTLVQRLFGDKGN